MTEIAAIYARVSTDNQNKPDKFSLEDQIIACRKRAIDDGYEVPHQLIYSEAMSGTFDEDKRPKFGEMITAAQAGKFQRVYFYKIDRFGRDLAVITSAFKKIKLAKVEPVSVVEHELGNDLILALFAGQAALEHQAITERTAPKRRAKRDMGYWVMGTPPYGYDINPDRTLKHCRYEAGVLRLIFELAREMGNTNVARHLNEKDIPPGMARLIYPDGTKKYFRIRSWEQLEAHKDKTKAKEVNKPRWQGGAISSIVRSKMAYGFHQVKEVTEPYSKKMVLVLNEDGSTKTIQMIIEEGHGVIPKKTWEEVNKAKSKRHWTGSRSGKNHLLSGILKCGNPECGHSYKHFTSGGGKWNYYRCSAHHSGTNCSNATAHAPSMDHYVLRAVSEHLFRRLQSADILGQLLTKPKAKEHELINEINAIKDEVLALEAERTGIQKLMRVGGFDIDDAPDYGDRLKEIRDRLHVLGDHDIELDNEVVGLRAYMATDKSEAEIQANKAINEILNWDTGESYRNPTSPLMREIVRDCVELITVRQAERPGGRNAVMEMDLTERLEIQFKPDDDALPAAVRRLASAELNNPHDILSVIGPSAETKKLWLESRELDARIADL